MTTQTEALKLADRLLDFASEVSADFDTTTLEKAADELRRLDSALAQPEQEREHITDGSPCWCEPDIEHYGLEPWQSDKKSATHGMTLGQRIAYVGGQVTDTGRVEFGSPMAVKALVDHVLRDITPPQRTWVGLTDDEIEMIVENRRAAHWEFVRQVEELLRSKNTCHKQKH